MYTFEVNINHDYPQKALVIFSGQLEGDDISYGAIFEKELSKFKNAPDYLIFIYPAYLNARMYFLLNLGESFHRNIMRYGERTKIEIFSFDMYANLKFVESPISPAPSTFDSSSIGSYLIEEGLKSLVKGKVSQVIQKSPPGTIFVKPSKEEFDEFVKTSELAVGYSEVQFVGYCLLSKRPRDITVKNIWIDTSGISPYIESLTYYMYQFSKADGCKSVRYHSFKSYENLLNSKPDHIEDVWMIISASTSNKLGMKACMDWGLKHEQVVTMLSYKESSEDKDGDGILVNISEYSDSRKKYIKVGTSIGINVYGENFTAQVKKPNQVVIRAIHAPKEILKTIYPLHNKNVFIANKADINGKVRSIFLDFEALIQDKDEAEKIRVWVKKVLDWHTPINLKWIIFDNTNPSEKVFFEIVKSIISIHFNGSNIEIIDLKNADSTVTGDGSAIILSSIISGGRSLIVLNRNLRLSKHSGNRIFLVPFAISAGATEYDNMIKTLTYGPENMKYAFFNMHSIFTGISPTLNSWQEEYSIIQNFSEKFWQDRSRELSMQSVGLQNNIGVSRGDNCLGFAKDYAFWGKGYDPKNVNYSSIYLTICSILQGLRDKPFTDFDSDSLSSNVYQNSVISPENFVRYDDPILQSCLWRAAKHTELDYSSSSDMSDDFLSVLKKLGDSFLNGESNAFIEFLLGVATLKIRVCHHRLALFMDYALSEFSNDPALIELLLYIEKLLLNRIPNVENNIAF